MASLVATIIASQTQESFKVGAARRAVKEAITERNELKQAFDDVLSECLEKYGIIVLDASVVNLDFSKAVEENQIASRNPKEPFIFSKKQRNN